MAQKKQVLRKYRREHVRRIVSGTSERPRLSVYRSLKHIHAQLINDVRGETVVAASSHEKALRGDTTRMAAATRVGALIAERAKAKEITTVVFDRGCFRYHGKIKAVAEAAREGGLTF
ncbi:MAG: 50S ribosomal protein L18 [Deltaproteobacteria bacterium]|nr:50S ribosomal protein L18 [Deltaproteobacteria bacterium]